jgi:hypothetical protein
VNEWARDLGDHGCVKQFNVTKVRSRAMSQRTQCEQARQDEDGQGDASVLLGLEGLAVRDVVAICQGG